MPKLSEKRDIMHQKMDSQRTLGNLIESVPSVGLYAVSHFVDLPVCIGCALTSFLWNLFFRFC